MVFLADGAEGVGAVREVRPGPSELLVYIENSGDFVVPIADVRAVHDGKVILAAERLDPSLRAAIEHARDAEDPDYDESGTDLDDLTEQ